MKGIILAGGSGTRLSPLTQVLSKQLLPLYDKPMIYYPLSCLMLAGIREVLIISTPRDLPLFRSLFKGGEQLGMTFSYAVQERPRGLADAFIVGDSFIGSDNVALVLGDNIFYGLSFTRFLKEARRKIETNECQAVVFGYPVKDPSRYGVVAFDKENKVISIEEKPEKPLSNYAVPGIYFYSSSVTSVAKEVKPSPRGEIEITSINNYYLNCHSLQVELLGRGLTWLDTGTYDSLLDANNFIATIQKRTGLYVSCIEEIAFNNGWITKDDLLKMAKNYKTDYGDYLRYLAGVSS